MKIALTGFMGPWGQVPTIGVELQNRGMLADAPAEADWIYCHDPNSLLSLQDTGIPVVAKVLDMNWAVGEAEKGKLYIERLKASRVVLVNTAVVAQQIREMGFEGTCHVVGDPVNVDFDVVSAHVSRPRRLPFFMYGRLEDEAKRLTSSVIMIEKLNQERSENYTLSLAGPFLLPGNSYGIVRAKGFLSRTALTAHLFATKVVLAPSIKEGLGLIPLEAVTCGSVPVVADIPVMREVWGDTIPMFKADDADSFYEVVDTLRSNNFEWDLGPASKIAATYTPASVVDRIVGALK